MASNCLWRPPPERLTLAAAEVQVWRADLDLPEAHVQWLEQTLAEDELDRARRLYFVQDRRRFTVARGLLRAILGLYLDTSPQRLCFRYNVYSKPFLPENEIRFNLSHSGSMALLTFARRGRDRL
jgi:4'-phosphopantetheinyl transferase